MASGPSARRLPLSIVIVIVFLSSGTSRPLRSKRLRGVATPSPGLTIVREPEAYFGEHVNNQGCCNTQWIHFQMVGVFRADRPLQLGATADILLDGQRYPTPDVRKLDGAGGEQTIIVTKERLASVSELDARVVEVVLSVDNAPLRIRFDAAAVPLENGRNVNTWR